MPPKWRDRLGGRTVLHSAVKGRIRQVATSIGDIAPFRLLKLPAEDQRLLLHALPVVLFVRVGLWLVSMSRLHRMLTSRQCQISTLTPVQARRLAWAVTVVANRVPGATCLTRALALQVLLQQRGSHSDIRVGFVSPGRCDMRGHAWLEWQEEVLIGGGELSAFRTTVTLHA